MNPETRTAVRTVRTRQPVRLGDVTVEVLKVAKGKTTLMVSRPAISVSRELLIDTQAKHA